MIRLEDVHKSYRGHPVLAGIDLHINSGETMVIVGSSGTGKSVTLKHIVGLTHPDRGRILVDGQDITLARGLELERLLDNFGVLFQSGALINWMTIFENVALPLYEKTSLGDHEIAERVNEKLALVNLLGNGHKRPSEISGGMKKRAGLARAIIKNPKILLYDEPTSGLDPVMSRHIDNLIIDMQKKYGVTSVVVTHDLHSAFTIGDRIAMLHGGKVVEVAPPREFVASKHDCVQEFIKAQFSMGKVTGMNL